MLIIRFAEDLAISSWSIPGFGFSAGFLGEKIDNLRDLGGLLVLMVTTNHL